MANAKVREKILREIIDTEESYLNTLDFGVRYYMGALDARASSPDPDDRLLDKGEVRSIFQNLELLRGFSHEFLSQLKQNLDNPEAESDNASMQLAGVFTKFIPFFKLFIDYISSYDRVVKTITYLKDKKPRFAQFLQDVASAQYEEAAYDDISKDVMSVLICPIQRIPRYKLLLEALLKKTPKGTPDYDVLNLTWQEVAKAADFLNQEMKSRSNRDRVLEIQNSFVTPLQLVEPHRRFVCDGVLTKVCRRTDKKYYFVLFSDMLVYASEVPGTKEIADKKMYIHHRSLKIQSTKIKEVEDKHHEFAFQIMNPDKSFTVYCQDDEEYKKWLKALNDTIEQKAENVSSRIRSISTQGRTFSDVSSRSSGMHTPMIDETMEFDYTQLNDVSEEFMIDAEDTAPILTPHQGVKHCARCQNEFSIFKRKYNCQFCGNVTCSSCSPSGRKFEGNDKRTVTISKRVCDRCFDDVILKAANPGKLVRALTKRSDHRGGCWIVGDFTQMCCGAGRHSPRSPRPPMKTNML